MVPGDRVSSGTFARSCAPAVRVFLCQGRHRENHPAPGNLAIQPVALSILNHMPQRRTDSVSERYTNTDYLMANPTWDIEDSPWKAQKIAQMMQHHRLVPRTVVEVGCGAGGVLAELRSVLPRAELCGYEIAPDAAGFWHQHAASNIQFHVGDFLDMDNGSYDLLLLLDVLEHVSNPFDFLARLQGRAEHYIFHIPLDLSAASVLRETPLLHVRHKVGHVHYFTKGLALALLAECGYRVMDARYTGAASSARKRSWRTALAGLPRRMARGLLGADGGVRLLGGETLLVLAQNKGAA